MSMQGYVYILTHPGTPCIFYDHLFSDGMRRANSVWGSLKRLLSAGSYKVSLLKAVAEFGETRADA